MRPMKPEGQVLRRIKATEDSCLGRTNELAEAQLAYSAGAPAGFRHE